MKSGNEKVVESWHVLKSKSKNKLKKSDDEDEEGTSSGCWNRWKLIGSCISSRSKVDTSISGISGKFNQFPIYYLFCCLLNI